MDEVAKSGRYEESHELADKILDVDPVYTFFTSGSTGTPKGVIINNHNVIDYTDWAVKTFPINENTIMGNQSPFYFDIFNICFFRIINSLFSYFGMNSTTANIA